MTDKGVCSKCGATVYFKLGGAGDGGLTACDKNGRLHICDQDKRPIGQEVTGRVVEDFQLRDRRLTIRLDGKAVLEVEAGGRPLRLRLILPGKILEE